MTAETRRTLEQQLLEHGIALPHELRPYQWEGVSFLMHARGACLADQMGLGKTVQTAVALQLLFPRRTQGKILLVAPTPLLENWFQELKLWAPRLRSRKVRGPSNERRAHYSLPFQLWLTSYDALREDIAYLRDYPEFDVVVLDEAQRIKNPVSQTATACRMLPRNRSWALTGTPLENRLADLFSVFSFVKRGLLASVPDAPAEIHEAIGPYFLRRRKTDVLQDLPRIVDNTKKLELLPDQQAEYSSELALIADQIDASPLSPLAQITRLKLICNHARSGESAKIEFLRTLAEGLESPFHRVLVFSQYVKTLRIIKANLLTPCLLYHGGLSADERASVLRDFRNSTEPTFLLISLRAGGVGLNLNEADSVVLFDRWWNPSVEDQAIQRAHRYGRTTPLQVFRLLTVGTIESEIQNVLAEKKVLFAEYVEQAAAGPTTEWRPEEMRRLLEKHLRKW